MSKRASVGAVAKAVAKAEVAKNGYIEIEVGKIVAMRPALEKLMQLRLPAATSFRLAQMCNVLNPYLGDFEKVRVQLVQDLGEKIDGTGNYMVTEANKPKFAVEMERMGQEKVTIPAFKIKFPSTVEIEAQFLMPLEQFLEVADE